MTGKFQEYARLQQEKKKGRQVVIPAAKEHLLSRWGGDDRSWDVVHPSDMARKDWCERSTYYRVSGRKLNGRHWPEERFNFTLQTIFDEGHQIHDKWQTWLKEAGVLWGQWRCEICRELRTCRADELEHNCWKRDWDTEPVLHHWKYLEVPVHAGLISGHEDGAIGSRLIEFKSVGLGTLRHSEPALLAKFYNKGAGMYDLEGLWRALKHPMKSHVRQANIYMWCAQQMKKPFSDFDTCSIVYEYKPNQQSREFVISFSEEITEPLIARVDAIEYALERGKPPKCPYGGCKSCKVYEDEAAKPRVPGRRVIWRSADGSTQARAASRGEATSRHSRAAR